MKPTKTIKNRGFSLLEMLVVLSIISVILSFYIPWVVGEQEENVVPTLNRIQNIREQQKTLIQQLHDLRTK